MQKSEKRLETNNAVATPLGKESEFLRGLGTQTDSHPLQKYRDHYMPLLLNSYKKKPPTISETNAERPLTFNERAPSPWERTRNISKDSNQPNKVNFPKAIEGNHTFRGVPPQIRTVENKLPATNERESEKTSVLKSV